MYKSINNNKRLLITHIADVDGMGSAILAKKVFKDEFDLILCEVYDLEEIYQEDLSSYEVIYQCDLPMTQKAIEIISERPDIIEKLKHFDHHISSIREDNPSFVNAIDIIDGKHTCGT